MKLLKTIVASVLVVGMGSAFAAEPVALTETQMDNVSAGGFAFANSGAIAAGTYGAATLTTTNTFVKVLDQQPTQGGLITQDWAHAGSLAAGIAL